MFSVSVQSDQMPPVISISGRLDTNSSPLFSKEIEPLLEKEKYLIVDMSRCNYLSSSGIRLLLSATKTLRAKGGRLLLAGLTGEVYQVIEMTGLQKVFDLFDNVRDARDFVCRPGLDTSVEMKQPFNGEHLRMVMAGKGKQASGFWEGDAIAGYNELGFSVGEGCPSEMCGIDEKVNGMFVTAFNCAGFIPFDEKYPPDFRVADSPASGSVYVQKALSFGVKPSAMFVAIKPGKIKLSKLIADIQLFSESYSYSSNVPIAFALAGNSPQRPSLSVGCVVPAGFFKPIEKRLSISGIAFENHVVPGATFLLGQMEKVCENTSPEELTRKVLTFENVLDVEPLGLTFEIENPVVWLFLPHEIKKAPQSVLFIEMEESARFDPRVEFLVRRIYNDSAKIKVKAIHGGYSAQTYQVDSYDKDGRKLRPTVLKVANRAMIAREAERCQKYALPYIFNNSAMVLGAQYFGDTGALRYNFVGIGGEHTRLKWLTHLFESWPVEKLEPVFDKIFREILKPWYGQTIEEKIALFHDHDPTLTFFPMIEDEAKKLFSISSDEPEIKMKENGQKVANPFWFLKHEYKRIHNRQFDYYTSVCHGDLNMQNILLDQDMNVYLIDFSETRPRSVVSDFARLEAIFMIEYANVEAPEELKSMMEFASRFYVVSSLDVLPENSYSGLYSNEMDRNVP
jgi:anti-anti-sigma factor